jgi:hypothetical protein
MANSNNQLNLFIDCGYHGSIDMTTRAGKLVYVKDNKILVGSTTRDCIIDYNADYGREHPYVPFDDYGSITTYLGQVFSFSSNSSTVVFGGDWLAYQRNGLGCTFIDTYYPVSNIASVTSNNLSSRDSGNGSYPNVYEKYEHGSFVIGPKAAFNEYVTVPTKQYKYWEGIDPSELFDTSYMNMESSGNRVVTYGVYSGSVPEITDTARGKKILPNLLPMNNPPLRRLNAGEFESAIGSASDSQTDTRCISFGRYSSPTVNGMRQRYNLGDLSLPSEDDAFSFYLKIMPSGISDSRYVTLFQNHGIKVNLENNAGDTDYQLAIYTKNHVDSTYHNGLPDNANFDYGFEPSPSAKNVDRSLNNISNNVIHEWMGEDATTRNSLVQANHYVNTKFALGSFRSAGIETLERVGGINSVTNNGYPTSVTTYDDELKTWWNCSFRFPERIKTDRTTSIVVTYDGQGDATRRAKILNQVRHPYNSGIIVDQCPTMSVMYGPIDKGITNALNGYSTKYDEPDYVQTQPHTLKTYASYDLNFVNTKPIQSVSAIDADVNAQSIYANGYKYKDYFTSGYLGDSYFIGTIDEFGYVQTAISRLNARNLLDSVVNTSAIVGRDVTSFYQNSGDFSDDFNPSFFSISSTKKVRFRVDPNYGTWDRTSIGDPSTYAVSSCMYFHVTDYPAYEEDRDKDAFFNLYPFPEAEDLTLSAVVKHSSPNGAAPSINFVIEDRPYPMTNNRSIEKNYSGRWVSPSIQLSASGGITNIYTSGVFDGGCGFWDLSNKSVRLNVQYPSSGNAYSATLDVFAINLDVDWFKTAIPITGTVGDVGYLPLYTHGSTYEGIASGIDLYVEAARMIKDLSLYTKYTPTHSGMLDLYMRGSTAGWEGFAQYSDLYTDGHAVSGINIDLYMPDPQLRINGTLNAFIGPSYNYVPMSSIVPMTTQGSFVSPSGRQADIFMRGTSIYGDVNPEYVMTAFVNGVGPAPSPTNALNLYIHNTMESTNKSTDLYLYNQWSGSLDQVNLTTYGSGKYDKFMRNDDGISLYIERKMMAGSRSDLFILGHDSPIGSGVDMSIIGANPKIPNSVDMTVFNNRSNDRFNLFTRGF